MSDDGNVTQMPIQVTPYASPMHNFQGAIVLLTNPNDDLYKLELALRGMTSDKNGNPVQTGEPLMNQEGIQCVLGQVQSIVSQNTNMSNLKDGDIAKLMVEQLGDAVIQDLMINSRKYGIKNHTARTRIITMISNSAFITMSRALDEGERRFWKGSQQEITMRTEGGGSKGNSKGMLSGVGSMLSGAFGK